MSVSLEELDDIVFAPQRRGPRNGAGKLEELEFSVVRELNELDLVDISQGRPLVPQRISTPSEMKHSHHQLAQLIAQGREVVEISYLTGYTPSYISALKGGKDFQELIGYYQVQREQIFVDTMARMKVAGVSSLERLQALLDDQEEKWTKRELMEMAELMLIKPGQAKGASAPSGASPVTVNVKFVSAPERGEAVMLDITPEDDHE